MTRIQATDGPAAPPAFRGPMAHPPFGSLRSGSG
jgi:hypothetical protein